MLLRIADFDELILKCRDEEAKSHITEAIACYYAGAYRACIVTTWIAVVFDIVNKLYELDQHGEGSVKEEIEKIKNIQEKAGVNNDGKIQSQNFERNILKTVKEKFELLDEQQYIDLQRLQDDRNRCAHPAFHKMGEPYKPPAELARLHIRNAIEHVLSQPPVLGKSALKQLISCVQSQYFHTDIEHAKEELKNNGLLRPKYSLTKSFVEKLILLIQEVVEPKLIKRVITAVKVCLEIEPTIEKKIIELLNTKISTTHDTCISQFICLAFNLPPQIFSMLNPGIKEKIYNVMSGTTSEDSKRLLQEATLVNDDKLINIVKERINDLSVEELSSIIDGDNKNLSNIIVDNAVKRYCEVESFNQANNVASKLIFPLISQLTKEHIDKIIKAADKKEADLIWSHMFTKFLVELDKEKLFTFSELKQMITNKDLENLLENILNNLEDFKN